MKHLARRIVTELKTSKVSAIYNSELARVFPKSMPSEERRESIKKFAEANGLSVDIFDVGLCAIFEKVSEKKPKKRKR